ncbi:MAG: hypothetical protein ACFCUU_05855 [Cyclobacteriaceae bacterium]
MKDKILFKSKIDVFYDNIVFPFAVIGFITVLFHFDKIDFFTFIIGVSVVLLIPIFESKQFLLSTKQLTIRYAVINLSLKFTISEITKIRFYSNDTAYDPCVVKIYFDNRVRKYYFLAHLELQELIDKLRELGVKVEVHSHIWK